jgi:ankyrin repeat protein
MWESVMWAVHNRRLGILLRAKFFRINIYQPCLIWLAAEQGHVSVLELLLSNKGKSVSLKYGMHFISDTPISIACRKGHHDFVKALLDPGAEVHAPPLHYTLKHDFT